MEILSWWQYLARKGHQHLQWLRVQFGPCIASVVAAAVHLLFFIVCTWLKVWLQLVICYPLLQHNTVILAQCYLILLSNGNNSGKDLNYN